MNTTAEESLSLEQLINNPFDSQQQTYNISEDDKKLHVRFYVEPMEQPARSIKENRRIFEDTEFVEILIPGDKLNIIRRQVFPMDKQRFPQQYARFKQGLTDQTIGTPLTELTFIPSAKVKEYEFFNVRTVEQLAGASDGSEVGQRMMGFHADKTKAQQFLDIAKGNAPVNELRQKLDEKDEQIAILNRQMAEMNASLAEMREGKKSK